MWLKGRSRVQKIISIAAVLLITLLLLNSTIETFIYTTLTSAIFSLSNTKSSTPYVCSLRGERWIVITTIFYPTPAIYKFLNLTTQWNLIVIGDRKTPLDWFSRLHGDRSRVIFLSLDKQQSLGYSILKYLPEGSYARKNVGYLIAIACGARIIFESDDDNLLETDDIRVLPKVSKPNDIPLVAFRRQRSPFINIYGSFGHPEIWPRGFPVDELRNVTEDGWHSIRRNDDTQINPYIQQYLADLDPDVDALYRLTHPLSIGRIQFDPNQPPIALQPFTFSSYNTQNTVTHYEAFWGLYLPVTTTFRVCDIWRGFWVQRLLWDIGGRLVFATATVKQIRNAHSYIKDMDEEAQMYHQSGSFARFLTTWSSSLPSLAERIARLAADLAQAHFWQNKEIDIMNAWLNDLHSIGYSFPPIVSPSSHRAVVRKRAAVCITGSTESFQAWTATDINLRQCLRGEIDTFLFLSSSLTNLSVPLSAGHKQLRADLNSTVAVFYENRVIDPNIPADCHPQFHVHNATSFHIPSYFQQLWAQAECYKLVKDYQQRFNIQYQLLGHARVNTIARLPATFERMDPFNVNTTLIASPVRYYPVYDDGLTIGPMRLMPYYMTRWVGLQECPSDRNYEPGVFMMRYISRFANVTVDPTMGEANSAI